MGNETKTIKLMIEMYCSHFHQSESLCKDCLELHDYACLKIGKCPFGPDKPACNQCTIHCYKPEKREQVKTVMRWAGPRMMYKHPVLAMQHLMKKNPPAKKPGEQKEN